MDAFDDQLSEGVKVELKAGDNEGVYHKLLEAYSHKVAFEHNETYRSIHYTIYARSDDILTSSRLEIQTRSIFEEGWSEINHRLVYKKGSDNSNGLITASAILSQLAGTCDSMRNTMKLIHDNGEDEAASASDGVYQP